MVRSAEIREHLQDSEKKLENEKYEDSLISSAKAIYKLCESFSVFVKLMVLPQNIPEENEIVFPETWDTNFKVSLIEHGVDPHEYHKFKAIAPEIGKNKITEELVPWWDESFGHPKNWTKENAEYCLHFAVDTTLKYQKDSTIAGLEHYSSCYLDVITSEVEECIINNISAYPGQGPWIGNSVERKPIKVLKKGEEIFGYANRSKQHQDEVHIYSTDLSSHEDIHKIGIGYVKYSDVSIKRLVLETREDEVEIQQETDGT